MNETEWAAGVPRGVLDYTLRANLLSSLLGGGEALPDAQMTTINPSMSVNGHLLGSERSDTWQCGLQAYDGSGMDSRSYNEW